MATASLEESALVLGEPEFAKISKLAYDHFGLDLHAGKQGLVAARLSKKIRQLGLHSFGEYYQFVLEDRTGDALESMVDDLTTNHTSFFRESQHFDLLRKTILPQLKNKGRVDIWSAACSSGEEPYTIAISVAEELGLQGQPEVRILASDISTRVLGRAKRAVYAEDRFRGIALPLLQQYLLRSTLTDPVSYLIKPELRAMVEFQHMNLMQDFSSLQSFQVIFCRNVMIYFDKPTQQNLVHRLTAQLEPGGYLLIGHSENLNSIDHGLQYVQPATYRKLGVGSESRRGAR